MAVRPRCDVLALCTGVGGLELGVDLAIPGARLVCAVEREAFAASTLVARMADKALGQAPARMADKALGQAPVWDDVATFDGRPWRGAVDLVTAGFPCQPWSQAGSGLGTRDPRWLWPAIAQIIADVDPGLVFVENVPRLASGGGLDLVLDDLAALGFDAEWATLAAADLGAPHLRRRLFVLAYRNGRRLPVIGPQGTEHAPRRFDDRGGPPVADAAGPGLPSGPGRVPRPQSPDARRAEVDGHRPDGRGEALADPGRLGSERRGGPGVVEGPQDGPRREARELPRDPARDGGAPLGDAERGALRPGLRSSGPAGLGSRRPGNPDGALGDADSSRRQGSRPAPGSWPGPGDYGPWPPGPDDRDAWEQVAGAGGPLPSVRRVADGLAYRLDRLHAIGNGVVPVVAAYALVALARRAGLAD